MVLQIATFDSHLLGLSNPGGIKGIRSDPSQTHSLAVRHIGARTFN